MKKKGMGFGDIAVLLLVMLVLIVIFVLFILPEGFLRKAADTLVQVVKEKLGGRPQEFPETQVKTPENIEKAFDDLVKTLRDNLDTSGCFIKYNTLPDLDDNTFVFSFLEDKMVARLYNEKKQIVKTQEITGLRPCVVAGIISDPNQYFKKVEGLPVSVYPAGNFYYNWIQSKTKDRWVGPEFIDTKEIILRDENRITWDGKKSYREDNQLIYKADRSHACFFPTWSRVVLVNLFDANFDEDGLHSSQIEKIIDVPQCSSP